MLAIGCYTAPDYSGTHFKCDDDHGCPAGQQCINGRCNGSGSGSADGPMPDVPPQALGVYCRGPQCATGQKCCIDFVSQGATCLAAAATCTGFAALCDGKEDCGGMWCCELGTGVIDCAVSCTALTICQDNTDCPTGASQCCPSVNPFEPWGRCQISCP